MGTIRLPICVAIMLLAVPQGGRAQDTFNSNSGAVPNMGAGQALLAGEHRRRGSRTRQRPRAQERSFAGSARNSRISAAHGDHAARKQTAGVCRIQGNRQKDLHHPK